MRLALGHRGKRAGAVGFGETARGQAKFDQIIIGIFGVD